MKTTVTVLLALVSFGIFAFVQFVQGEDKPTAEQPPKQLPTSEAPVDATPTQIQHLLKIREKMGSKLQGKLLESDPEASQDDFTKALQRVTQQRQIDESKENPAVENIDHNVVPAEFSTRKLPLGILPAGRPISISDDNLLYMLRSTSMALDYRAGQLELLRDFDHAHKLRKQAKKLRKQAILVESLNAEQPAISVDK